MAFLNVIHALLLIPLGISLACHPHVERIGTRAGVAIGIEARHRAIEIAEAIGRIPDAPCGAYDLSGPVTVRVDWSLVGDRDGQRQLAITETRLLEGDDVGRWRFRRSVDFQQASGRIGRREREWRLIDGQLYSKDHNLPFERRPVDVTDVERLLGSASEVFDTLVAAAADRWTAVLDPSQGYALLAEPGLPGVRPQPGEGSAEIAIPDRQTIRCGRPPLTDPWLEALASESRLVRASADVDIDPQSGQTLSRQGEWVFEGIGESPHLELIVQVREEIARGSIAEPITVPDEVFDSTRPRLWRSIENLLGDLEGME